MTIRIMRAGAAVAALALGSAAGWAQSNQAASQTVPGLENFSLPASGRPAQSTPAPTQVPTPSSAPIVIPGVTPSPTPTPRAARPVPTPSPTATPRAQQTPAPAPAATATPAPSATSGSVATPTAEAVTNPPVSPVAGNPASEPAPAPSPSATPEVAEATGGLGLLQWIGIGIVLLGVGLVGGFLLARRRRPPDYVDHEIRVPVQPEATELPQPDRAEPAPVEQSPPQAVPPPPAQPRNTVAPSVPAPSNSAAPAAPEFLVRSRQPTLTATIRPRRAGTNLTGAAVDYIITLTNPGASPAQDIRVDLGLLSASAQQDAQLRGFFGRPVERPVVAPFELPPGGQIELTGMATLPRDALHVMEAQGRAFFVPVVAMSAHYRSDQKDRHMSAAWIIGVDRGPEAKMAPFRLDKPPRMRNSLSSRVHEVA